MTYPQKFTDAVEERDRKELRDYFAAHALAGLLAGYRGNGIETHVFETVELAYRYADAALSKREEAEAADPKRNTFR